MNFLVDEDLPRSTNSLLQRYGHEAINVRDTEFRGASDAEIADYAQKPGICLLTGDMGFADIRNYPPGKCVVIGLSAKANSFTILTLLEGVLLQTVFVNHLNNKLAIVGTSHIRIRRG